MGHTKKEYLMHDVTCEFLSDRLAKRIRRDLYTERFSKIGARGCVWDYAFNRRVSLLNLYETYYPQGRKHINEAVDYIDKSTRAALKLYHEI